MTHVKDFLWRGALAGVAGGVLAALFNVIFTRVQINEALAIEEANAIGDDGEEMFSRATQVFGGFLGTMIFGLLIGLVFAVALAALWRGLPGRDAFGRAIRLAVVGYLAWTLVPGLKYPPNPPAVGDPDSVGERTAAYVGLVVVSLILVVLAWLVWQQLSARRTAPALRFAVTAGAYFVAVVVAFVLFPANPDEIEVPATLIWEFRVNSLASLALLWVTMGTAFGLLADRAASTPADHPAAAPV